MALSTQARAVVALLALVVAGCGGGGQSGTANSTTPSSPSPPPVVKAITATVDGKPEMILVDAVKGMTLYWFAPDKGAGKVTCTGGCLAVWPPMETAEGSAQPSGSGLAGALGTITDPNGKPQLTYKGWPLYWFVKDKSPGDTLGQGVGQKWAVATPDMAPNSGGTY